MRGTWQSYNTLEVHFNYPISISMNNFTYPFPLDKIQKYIQVMLNILLFAVVILLSLTLISKFELIWLYSFHDNLLVCRNLIIAFHLKRVNNILNLIYNRMPIEGHDWLLVASRLEWHFIYGVINLHQLDCGFRWLLGLPDFYFV